MEMKMRLPKMRALGLVPALFAGYLGLATSAYAQPVDCPLPLLPGQQDGFCGTNKVDTIASFRTSNETPPQELFIALSGLALVPGINVGIVTLTSPSEPGIPGLLPGVILPEGVSDALAIRVSTNPALPGLDVALISD